MFAAVKNRESLPNSGILQNIPLCIYARNNSGFVEGFNNKVKVLKRRCYGLANRVRLFQRIILDTLGFERFAPCVVAC